jgi:two-component system phosphate regulon sensor histidine kinase PhoR
LKPSKLNIILSFGLLALLGVLFMQVSMLRRAFVFEQKEFSDKIHFVLSDVVKKIYLSNKNELPLTNQVQKVSDDYYIVNINDHFDDQILEFYLKTEFEKVNLNTDYEYAIYNCSSDKMVYGNYISSTKEVKQCVDCFKVDPELTYYFAVRFPHIKYNLLQSLWYYWILFGVIFIVLIIYLYSFIMVIQQKRYADIQNDFINNMTHEFKTPLSSILLASNYLKQNKAVDFSKVESYSDMMHTQATKLNQHIETLLRVAKSESKRLELNKTWMRLVDLVEDVKMENAMKYPELNLQLTIDRQIEIFVDSFHFKNIMSNFIDNAIKYNSSQVGIEIKSTIKNKKLELSIADTGFGVDSKDLPFLFDKFYRVPRQNNMDVEGFGLGLFYAKKITKLHGWTIEATKNSPKGLKVLITMSSKCFKYD